MSIAGTLGKLAVKTFGKNVSDQTEDVFANYSLKSENALLENPIGLNKKKPMNSFIKMMENYGVVKEEIEDLGLLDIPSNQLISKQELLDRITYGNNTASTVGGRATVSEGHGRARVGGRATVSDQLDLDRLPSGLNSEKPDLVSRPELLPGGEKLKESNTAEAEFLGAEPYTKYYELPQYIDEVHEPRYSNFAVDIGMKDTYQEIVYTSRASPIDPVTNIVQPIRGPHFTANSQLNQLFHLRLNQGKVVGKEGETATNLLELQSDIQQIDQKKNLRRLPMTSNWEVLGVKEAIRQAVKRGDSYLAIPNWEETAVSVGNRGPVWSTVFREPVDTLPKTKKGRARIKKIDDTETSKYTILPEDFNEGKPGVDLGDYSNTGGELRHLYTDDDTDIDIYNVPPSFDPTFFEDDLKFADFQKIVQELSDEYGNSLENYVNFYLDAKFYDVRMAQDPPVIGGTEHQFGIKDRTEGLDNLVRRFLGRDDGFLAYMEDVVLDPDAVSYTNEVLRGATDHGIMVEGDSAELYFAMSKSDIAKDLSMTVEEVTSAAETDQVISIPYRTLLGGRGLERFYARDMIHKKRLKKYGVPLTTIKQYRNDGKTIVETNALDLRAFKGMNADDISMTLYAIPTGLLTAFGGSAVYKATQEENKRNKPALNQGGLLEEDAQMDKLFLEEGGLKDQGGSIDPVSGNDVPSGSTQSEVRDDIPAQLSEGEFVFPADVVRYIGLENLMAMRQKAKSGLSKMEAMGQMGNSEEAIMPDTGEFKPEIGSMIDGNPKPVGMNVGGFLSSLPPTPAFLNQKIPDYLKKTNVFTAPKYAGQEQQATQSVYQPNQFKSVAPIGSPNQPTPNPIPTNNRDVATQPLAYEMKKFRSATTGAFAYIPFMNGVPQFPVPEGYEEVSRDPTKQDEKETDTTADTDKGKVDTTKVIKEQQRDEKPDPVVGSATLGIARGLSNIGKETPFSNKYKEQLTAYRTGQAKQVAGTLLSLVTGPMGIFGSVASAVRGSKQLTGIEKTIRDDIEKSNKTIGTIIDSNSNPNISTSTIETSFTNALNAGVDPALAAAIAVTSPDGFQQPTLDINTKTGKQTVSPSNYFENQFVSNFTEAQLGKDKYRELQENAAYLDATGRGTLSVSTSEPVDYPSIAKERAKSEKTQKGVTFPASRPPQIKAKKDPQQFRSEAQKEQDRKSAALEAVASEANKAEFANPSTTEDSGYSSTFKKGGLASPKVKTKRKPKMKRGGLASKK